MNEGKLQQLKDPNHAEMEERTYEERNGRKIDIKKKRKEEGRKGKTKERYQVTYILTV